MVSELAISLWKQEVNSTTYDAAVTLEPCEADACGLLQESLFRLINSAVLTTTLAHIPLNPYSAADPP
jgi:hypothetical protein